MFIGHHAVAFAAKRVAPRTSLGTLMLAATLLDLIWPLFLLLGIESVRVQPGNTAFTPLDFVSYPWTHSLLMAAAWSIAAGAVYWWRTRYARGAVTVGCAVVSHWVLDFFTHRPDLPLYPGGPKVGLGLWGHPAATIVIESLMFAVGIAFYFASTRPRDGKGWMTLWSFIVFLAAAYVGNIIGPPPPSEHALAWAALLAWIFPLWAWSADRRREAVV
jgi:membrane-bound metal-dependent hydrolase YbcI (DUF457 family)